MAVKFANNASTTLSAGIAPAATSISVVSSTLFPAISAPNYCYCTLSDAATGNTLEIIKVTNISGTTWTVVRGQDGTTAQAYLSGDKVQLRLVTASLNNFPKLDEANAFTATNTFVQSLASTNLSLSTGKLVGRTTAGTGTVEEISVGAGLSLGTGSLFTSGAYTATGHTMSTARLLGRTTAGTGAAEEISVGTGLTLSSGSLSASGSLSSIVPVTASVASNALTLTLNACSLDFRSSTLSSGTVNTRTVSSPISTVISSGSTGGTASGVTSRIAVLAIDNAGTVELAWCNAYGSTLLDESALITTTAEGGAGAADSAAVAYSTTARTSVPFRIVGFVESTQATAGTWATAPSLIQGVGGISSATRLGSIQQSAKVTLSGTSVDFTGIPAWAKRITVNIAGLSSSGTSIPIIQIGDSGGIENTGYLGAGGYISATGGGQANSAGFMMYGLAGVATYTWHGAVTLTKLDEATATWVASGCGSSTDAAREWTVSGSKPLSSGPLTQVRLTTVNGTDTLDAGTASIFYE